MSNSKELKEQAKYLLPLINLSINQFIKKPLDYQELLSALLKASKKINQDNLVAPSHHIEFDNNFTYNKKNKSLHNGKENIHLTKYEIIFLELLTLNLGKIYSNEEIVAFYASKNETINSQNIRKLVSKIRKKLPKNTLESIYGIGYRIN
jgi:DNA-binding response OmpR family regulator